jgi:methylthioribose-1-phosphate isomerase
MLIDGKHYRSIWLDEDDNTVIRVIDQKKLPFFFVIEELRSVDDVYNAIKDMTVRGAPLIGAAGAFGMYLATLEATSRTNMHDHLSNAARYLSSCRPTAINLSRAVKQVLERIDGLSDMGLISGKALKAALEICDNEIDNCIKIGEHGLRIIMAISEAKKGSKVNILTHCNAGWLACIDYGTATAPIYLAHQKGIPVHIWVDETRPVNQGARLTAWELGKQGVPYTLIADNTGGHLMQKGMVDLVLTGSDRTSANGDVANKIGTYLKALAARDNKIPFYTALPTTSFDLSINDGLSEIPVEERDPSEITEVTGLLDGEIKSVRICPEGAKAGNWSFDITPARLITGLITEKGVCRPVEKEIRKLLSDKIN